MQAHGLRVHALACMLSRFGVMGCGHGNLSSSSKQTSSQPPPAASHTPTLLCLQ